MPITSTGIGSGLDVEGLVAQLVLAEIQPKEVRLARQETTYQTEISSYGFIKSALSDFQSAVKTVADASTYQSKSVSVSDYTKLNATASSGAANATYDLTVSALAAKQALATQSSFSSSTSTVGTGTLTVSTGTTVYNSGDDTYTSFTPKSGVSDVTITIDSSNNTLAGVRDAINASSAGVTAAIVYTGSAYELTISSDKTGAENSVAITVDDDDGTDTNTSGLSALAFSSAATNLSQSQAGSDASLTINGLQITSDSNTVDDALDNVSITLKETFSAPETITVAEDSSKISSAVSGFVDAYNEFIDVVNQQTSYDADSQTASTLTGDATIRTIQSQLRSALNQKTFNSNADLEYLAQIGVTTDATTGKFQLDSSVLTDAIDTDPLDVATVLANFGRTSSSNVVFLSSTSATDVGNYDVAATQTSTAGSWTAGSAVTDLTYQGGGGGNAANFTVTVDSLGTASVEIDNNLDTNVNDGALDATEAAALASDIETQVNTALGAGAVSVSITAGVITITSGSTGTGSTVSVDATGDTDNSGLGITTGTSTAGTTTTAYTINGSAATLDGTTLTGATGTAVEGLKLQILGGASANLGTVYYSQGLASNLDAVIDDLLGSSGLIQARLDGLEASIDDLEDSRLALETRATNLEAIYRDQFNGLETLISSINETGSFLSQALSTSFIEPLSFKKD